MTRSESVPSLGRQSGFTLVELMLVVAIIGILASLAIPSFGRYVRKARTVEATSALAKIATGAQLYYQKNTAEFASLFRRLQAAPSFGAPGGSSGGASSGGASSGGASSGGHGSSGSSSSSSSSSGGTPPSTPAGTQVNQLPASSAGYAPAQTHATACASLGGVFPASASAAFDAEPWRSLSFTLRGNFRYRYLWLLADQPTPGQAGLAYAHALGDLDCNGTYSVFRVIVQEQFGDGTRFLQTAGPFLFSGTETD